MDFDDFIKSLPPEEQAEIEAGSKRIIQSVIESRRTSGTLRYLIVAEDCAYTARCLDVDIASEGDTQEEAVANLREALELFLEGAPQTNITFKEFPDWAEEYRRNKDNIEFGQFQVDCLKNLLPLQTSESKD